MTMIKRARTDCRLLGVCGGIAHTYGWNPTVVPTLVGYLALGLILPTSN